MLKLKLQYFGHLMWRVDSSEKTLRLGGIEGRREGYDRGWDGWMASLTRWAWVWVNSGSLWWTERPGVLRFMGSKSRTRLSDWTELNYSPKAKYGVPSISVNKASYNSHSHQFTDCKWQGHAVCMLSPFKLCLTLCDPMDWSPLGFSIHGSPQAKILEWGAISSSRGSSRLRDQTHVSYVSWIGRWVLYH